MIFTYEKSAGGIGCPPCSGGITGIIRGYYKGRPMYLCKAHSKWVSQTATMLAYPVIEKITTGDVEEPKKIVTTFDL